MRSDFQLYLSGFFFKINIEKALPLKIILNHHFDGIKLRKWNISLN